MSLPSSQRGGVQGAPGRWQAEEAGSSRAEEQGAGFVPLQRGVGWGSRE